MFEEMKSIIVKKSGMQGKGLFANKNFEKDEKIMHVDLRKLKSYSRKEIDADPKLQSDHCDYVGHNRYVISFHPYSYINHSCNPNIYTKHRTIGVSDIYAMRDIKKGEELTCDYGANAMDQFGKNEWTMNCKCGDKNCRKKIPSDFFKQPITIQKKYYRYLPASIKRKYKKEFDKPKTQK